MSGERKEILTKEQKDKLVNDVTTQTVEVYQGRRADQFKSVPGQAWGFNDSIGARLRSFITTALQDNVSTIQYDPKDLSQNLAEFLRTFPESKSRLFQNVSMIRFFFHVPVLGQAMQYAWCGEAPSLAYENMRCPDFAGNEHKMSKGITEIVESYPHDMEQDKAPDKVAGILKECMGSNVAQKGILSIILSCNPQTSRRKKFELEKGEKKDKAIRLYHN